MARTNKFLNIVDKLGYLKKMPNNYISIHQHLFWRNSNIVTKSLTSSCHLHHPLFPLHLSIIHYITCPLSPFHSSDHPSYYTPPYHTKILHPIHYESPKHIMSTPTNSYTKLHEGRYQIPIGSYLKLTTHNAKTSYKKVNSNHLQHFVYNILTQVIT